MITYKGTDKAMKCHGGFQYELGKTVTDTGAIRCGGKGFHSCEAPFDVLRYFPMRDGNRYFTAEAAGTADRDPDGDSKIATSELTLKAEIGLSGLIKAQLEYTRKKAEEGGTNGDFVNLAGGDRSNLAGGGGSNLAGGDRSNLVGGGSSNLVGGDCSNLVGGDRSNLAGGVCSNLAGGDWSNLAGGADSNLAGGAGSMCVGRNGCKMKGGLGSVLVFTRWGWAEKDDGASYWSALEIKPVIVDGQNIKADVWYELKDGEVVEVGGAEE